jgi:natural product biosynthesis luciferase-like monooxygenase protein
MTQEKVLLTDECSNAGNESARELHSGDAVFQEHVMTSPVESLGRRRVEFGLFFFSSSESVADRDKYGLLMESSKYADEHGFSSVWIPERHFTKEGGLYPNPVVLHAALARETTQIGLRAGSVVLPLHDPIRVAEEWSMVDNLSGGRVGLSFASGWHPNDFVFFPEKYSDRHEEMYRGIETVQKLWRGESITVNGVDGKQIEVRIYPTPLQPSLPVWVTAAGSPLTFEKAGELGANLLTHLFNQSFEELAEKIKIYREALAAHGHDPQSGRVTVAVPAFVTEDESLIRGEVQESFRRYIRSASYLLKAFAQNKGRQIDFARLSAQELDEYIGWICDRLISEKRVLFGTLETCSRSIAELSDLGVDEVICQLDFGVKPDLVLQNLPYLNQLRERFDYPVAVVAPCVLKDEAIHLNSSAGTPANSIHCAQSYVDPIFSKSDSNVPPERLILDIQARCPEELAGSELYERLNRRGAEFDSGSQQLERLWSGDGEALGQLRLSDALLWEADAYRVHPALLDACFQLLVTTLPPNETDSDQEPLYEPVGLRSLRVYGRPEKRLWNHAHLRPGKVDGVVEGDVRILNEQGEVVVQALGLQLQRAVHLNLAQLDQGETMAVKSPAKTNANGPEGEEHVLRDSLLLQEPRERGRLLEVYICEQVARVLELPASKIDIDQPVNTLGLDSLMAIQLKNRIECDLGVNVPVATFLRGASVAELSLQLLPQLTPAWETDSTSRVLGTAPDALVEHPLSKGQKALWFMHQFSTGSAYNTIELAVTIRGALDIEALQSGFQALTDRHPSLRTVYRAGDEGPVQVVLASQVADFKVTNAEGWTAPQLDHHMAEEYRRPFDLEKGPLLRANLFTRSDHEHVFSLAAHHIAVDFLSMEIILNELQVMYFAAKAGVPAALPHLNAQYADYVKWQAEMLDGVEGERLWGFWQRELAGELPVLKLPTDRPRPLIPTNRGAIHKFKLDEDQTRQLRSLAKAEKTTLYTVVLAGLNVLLHRYSRQDDILINSPTANRSRSEFEGMVGFFANPVIVRSNLSGNPSFKAFLAQVSKTVLGALDHQDYPFSLLIEQLQPARDPSRTPLSDVVFNLDRPAREGTIGGMVGRPQLGALTMEPMIIEECVTRYDLVLVMIEGEESITCGWQYKSDLFDASTIGRMAGHLQTLLSSISAHPDWRLSELEPLTTIDHTTLTLTGLVGQRPLPRRMKSVKRKAIDLTPQSTVTTNSIQPGQSFPLVVYPKMNRLDPIEWAKGSQDFIQTKLLEHGAILFRGFKVASASEFEQFATASCPGLFGDYGDLPREEMGGKVYGSTPYPSDHAILPHNESSQLHCWPLKIWFYCAKAPLLGGETPIVDCRKVYQSLDPALRDKFAQQGLMYVRNYVQGFDVSWQEFFRTSDRSEVEAYCRGVGMEFEWKGAHGLRTRKICPAVATHPKTGEVVMFNQIQAHHVSCLEPSTREALLSLFKIDDLPRNVYYGDGSVIEDSVVDTLREVYRKSEVSFPWQEGDILMLDNMLSAHGRSPYTGPRKILVTMGEMFAAADLQPEGEAMLANAV